MIGELIKEYLVGLGVQIDKPGFAEMKSTIDQTSGVISAATGSWGKNFAAAAGIIGTAIASVTTAVAGLVASAAKQDLAMEKYARQMLVSKDAAMEMKTAIDALGESVQDIQLTPELFERYKSLVGDGRKMKIGGDYENAMRGVRDVMFEFTRLKQEASYALQWVGYYLTKYLAGPMAEAKASLRGFNDSIIKHMPIWTEKAARALVYIINIGRHFWDLMKAIGKTIYDVWDAFPRGVKIATAALSAFFLVLKASPMGRMIALFSSLLLLVDDYFAYMEGKQAALGPVWDKLNEYIGIAKEKIAEWGRALAPVWEKFLEYLGAAKDYALDFGRQCMALFERVGQSKALGDFLGVAERLGEALWNLGGGIINFVMESCKSLFDSLRKQDSASKFTDLMQRLWDITLGLIDTISEGIGVLASWFEEAAKSEIVRDLIDACVELFNAVMDLIGAFAGFLESELSAFFGGIGKTEPVYSFRDAVKAVVTRIIEMIRYISRLVQWLSDFYKMMKDNRTFKAFWEGMGKAVGEFSKILMNAISACGKLGQALSALVSGNWSEAVRLTREALGFGGVAEASGRKFSFDGEQPTGELSAPYESNGDPGAVGKDSTGGWSYGTYQIAEGTMPSFLEYLGYRIPKYREALENAGVVGTVGFTEKWREIASIDPGNFGEVQRAFIADTHYAPQAQALADMGIDLDQRSKTLREVVWSMSVQMGGYTPDIFRSALNGKNIGDIRDEELIPLLYEYRKHYFSQSTPAERESVFRRFDREELPAALDMLKQEREYKSQLQEQNKVQFLNQSGEPLRYEFKNPSEGSRDPTWWDYTKEKVSKIYDNFKNWVMPTAARANEAVANLDPLMVRNLMSGNAGSQTVSYGGSSTNVTYQIQVGGVTVSQTNASPQEIGQSVGQETAKALDSRMEYVLQNRSLSGGIWV